MRSFQYVLAQITLFRLLYKGSQRVNFKLVII